MASDHVHGVIFDLDGTLVHSSLDFQALMNAVKCPPGIDLLSHVYDQPDAQRTAYLELIQHHELQDAYDASWIEGAELFVQQVREQGLPMAIVTRNYSDAAHLKISNNQIPIDLIITREDAPAKPDPTALLNIAKQWQLDPKHLIYVGDYLYDVQAAANAGMRSCLYVSDDLPHYSDQADIVFSCYQQLHQRLFSD